MKRENSLEWVYEGTKGIVVYLKKVVIRGHGNTIFRIFKNEGPNLLEYLESEKKSHINN